MKDGQDVSAKPAFTLFRHFGHYGELNSYDLLKAIALVTMVIDHLGLYFWVDSLWIRAIGRMAFPLFLFLIGYSKSWTVRFDLLFYTVFLIAMSAITHCPIFPLNILATISAVRLLMGWLVRIKLSTLTLCIIFITCAILVLPTMYIFDYGTLAVLFALCGYLHRERPASSLTILFIECTLFLEGALQYTLFKFHGLTAYIMIAVLVMDMLLMNTFKIAPVKPQALPAGMRMIVQWLSRNTLPLYAAHIALFMTLSRAYGYLKLAHFRWF